MIRFERPAHIEGCRAHTERSKDQTLHGFVVGWAQVNLRVEEACGYVTRSGCHQIAVLEDFAEAAGGLHRSQQSHGGFGRSVLEFEDPLEVLARKPGTSANKMFKENIESQIRIAELEVRISFDYRMITSNIHL